VHPSPRVTIQHVRGYPAHAYAAVAGQRDWDRYEWTLVLNGERHAAAHPDDPAMGDLRAWVRAGRDRYLAPGGRDTLGFGLFLFSRPR
jgi:hypothetical protein